MTTQKQLIRYRNVLITQAKRARTLRRDNELLPAANAVIRRTDPGSFRPRSRP